VWIVSVSEVAVDGVFPPWVAWATVLLTAKVVLFVAGELTLTVNVITQVWTVVMLRLDSVSVGALYELLAGPQLVN
jgi:hypothetical protein